MDEDIQKPASRLSKKVVFYLLGALLLITSSVGVYAYKSHTSSNPFPENIRSSVNFSLYYPERLPNGLHVDNTSIRLSEANQAVQYYIKSGSAIKYDVSVQSYPSDFDFAAFKKKFTKTDEFTTNMGTVFVGDLGSQIIANVRTNDGGWILIYTKDTAGFGEVSTIARNFQKIP